MIVPVLSETLPEPVTKQAEPVNASIDHVLVQRILEQVARRVVGQEAMVERLLISLLTGGHVLLEGVPGLAKTLTVRTLAETVNTQFSRIQFTPDLLPADVIGTQVFDQRTSQFSVKQGPIFANIVLADEINRAPAKVQAALLEAMQEKQVTIGRRRSCGAWRGATRSPWTPSRRPRPSSRRGSASRPSSSTSAS
jgi:MoxR-like ATPase